MATCKNITQTNPLASILRYLSRPYSHFKPFQIQLTAILLKHDRDVFTSILKEALNRALLFRLPQRTS